MQDTLRDLLADLGYPYDPEGGIPMDIGYITSSSPPIVVNNTVVVGNAHEQGYHQTRIENVPGHILAYDAKTGVHKWKFNVIPQSESEFGFDTWENDAWQWTGDVSSWAPLSADLDRGIVYIPTNAPSIDYYGGFRPGDNLFGDSVIALDVDSGRRIWHFQLDHHPIWNYENANVPILADLTVNGQAMPALIQPTKQGLTFAFHRVTGEPIWPIEERPVPQSTTPGERTSPTQPFPVKPPAFDRQGATVDNLIDFTPELRQEALDIVGRYTMGPMFTPPTIRTETNIGTIQLPGSQGGADVQGGAFDPETGYLYVPSITAPFVADIVEGNPDRTNLRYVKGRRLWIGGPRGLPLFKPPYGRITALDMTKGEIVWQVPNGEGPRDHPAIRHLNLGRLGRPGRPSPVVTKTLLFIGEGNQARALRSADRIPEGMPLEIVTNYGEPWFRAYDKRTGNVLWEVELPGGTTGAPMTYMHQGTQYVVVAVEGIDEPAQWMAFSLPQ